MLETFVLYAWENSGPFFNKGLHLPDSAFRTREVAMPKLRLTRPSGEREGSDPCGQSVEGLVQALLSTTPTESTEFGRVRAR